MHRRSARRGTAKRAVAEQQLGQAVDRLLDAMRQGMGAAMREHELTPPLMMTLKMLQEPRSMRWLADVQQCDASNITGIVDRLEKRGLVERRSDPRDRRITLVTRTTLGDEVPGRFVESGVRSLPGLSDLDDAELATLVALLRRLVPEALTSPAWPRDPAVRHGSGPHRAEALEGRGDVT